MKRNCEPNWNEKFKLVENDARIALSGELRTRIIKKYRWYFDIDEDKEVPRSLASIKRDAIRFLRNDEDDALIRTAYELKRAKCSRRKPRGRPRNQKIIPLLTEFQACYEAAGGTVGFRRDNEGRLAGPYADFLKAIRQHIFQGELLNSDQALIERAKKFRSQQRQPSEPKHLSNEPVAFRINFYFKTIRELFSAARRH
jgi:hypothetical protein